MRITFSHIITRRVFRCVTLMVALAVASSVFLLPGQTKVAQASAPVAAPATVLGTGPVMPTIATWRLISEQRIGKRSPYWITLEQFQGTNNRYRVQLYSRGYKRRYLVMNVSYVIPGGGLYNYRTKRANKATSTPWLYFGTPSNSGHRFRLRGTIQTKKGTKVLWSGSFTRNL